MGQNEKHFQLLLYLTIHLHESDISCFYLLHLFHKYKKIAIELQKHEMEASKGPTPHILKLIMKFTYWSTTDVLRPQQ